MALVQLALGAGRNKQPRTNNEAGTAIRTIEETPLSAERSQLVGVTTIHSLLGAR
jgi:hypothetical protein